MIGWDEVLHPDLPQDIVIQSWRGQKSLAEAAAQGLSRDSLLGLLPRPSEPAQLPLRRRSAAADPPRKLTPRAGGAHSRRRGLHVDRVRQRGDGGFAHLAAHGGDRRALLVARGRHADVESMYARMEAVSRELEWTGVQHRANYAPMLDRMRRRVQQGRCACLPMLSKGSAWRDARARRQVHQPDADESPGRRRASRKRECARAGSGGGSLRRIRKRVAAEAAALRSAFTRWAANDARFQELAGGNPLLAELMPVSKDLSALGTTGLKILDSLQQGKPVPDGYGAELTRMEKPVAEVNLAATRPIRVLLRIPRRDR